MKRILWTTMAMCLFTTSYFAKDTHEQVIAEMTGAYDMSLSDLSDYEYTRWELNYVSSGDYSVYADLSRIQEDGSVIPCNHLGEWTMELGAETSTHEGYAVHELQESNSYEVSVRFKLNQDYLDQVEEGDVFQLKCSLKKIPGNVVVQQKIMKIAYRSNLHIVSKTNPEYGIFFSRQDGKASICRRENNSWFEYKTNGEYFRESLFEYKGKFFGVNKSHELCEILTSNNSVIEKPIPGTTGLFYPDSFLSVEEGPQQGIYGVSLFVFRLYQDSKKRWVLEKTKMEGAERRSLIKSNNSVYCVKNGRIYIIKDMYSDSKLEAAKIDLYDDEISHSIISSSLCDSSSTGLSGICGVTTSGRVVNYYWSSTEERFIRRFGPANILYNSLLNDGGNMFCVNFEGEIYSYGNWGFSLLVDEQAEPILGGSLLKVSGKGVFGVSKSGKVYKYLWNGSFMEEVLQENIYFSISGGTLMTDGERMYGFSKERHVISIEGQSLLVNQ